MFDKKGAMTLGDLAPAAIALVVIAVTLGIGATVLATVQSGQTSGSYAYNASGSGLQGLDELAGFLPTIGVVVAAAVVIGVIAFLRGR